jgi:hypothetical protein
VANRTGQWSSNNEANGTPIWSPRDTKKAANALNANNIWQNQVPNFGGTANNTAATGVFGVNATSMNTVRHPGIHTGWVKQTVGRGRRAGRVQYETLVAGGMAGNSAQFNIVIVAQPGAVSNTGNTPVNISANAVSKNGVSLTYEWHFGNGNTVSTNAVYTNTTSKTLAIANVGAVTGNSYYASITDGLGIVNTVAVNATSV